VSVSPTELQGLSERWFRAWLEKDAATVERLAAEEYLYVAPSGSVLDLRVILVCHGVGETVRRMATRDGAVLLQQQVAGRIPHRYNMGVDRCGSQVCWREPGAGSRAGGGPSDDGHL
jgi:hypothetical protein